MQEGGHQRRRGDRDDGEAASHPPIEQEPGGLAVFDWSGYGNGDYYPNKERAALWQAYADQTGDTPQFILFENDDAGYTKVVAGTSISTSSTRAPTGSRTGSTSARCSRGTRP